MCSRRVHQGHALHDGVMAPLFLVPKIFRKVSLPDG